MVRKIILAAAVTVISVAPLFADPALLQRCDDLQKVQFTCEVHLGEGAHVLECKITFEEKALISFWRVLSLNQEEERTSGIGQLVVLQLPDAQEPLVIEGVIEFENGTVARGILLNLAEAAPFRPYTPASLKELEEWNETTQLNLWRFFTWVQVTKPL